MTPRRFATFFLLAASAIGCAARLPARSVVAESTAHLRAGCYRCLQEGLALVEGRRDLRSRQRAFEFALLLTARAKELGLPFARWAERADALAATLPPAAAAPAFVAIAGALRLDPAGLTHDEDFAQRRPLATPDEMRAWLHDIDSSGASPETRVYFALSVACGFLREDREAVMAHARAATPGAPLLEYALGACASSEEEWLLRALEHDPRFDDAAYPLGRYRLNRLMVQRPDSNPQPALARARAAFPGSAAIAYTEAVAFRALRDWPRALEGFDETLRLVPGHHEARLGRVLALSHLSRHEEAIAAATSLIDEGMWLVADAYYWRAWNQFTLGRLDESERDVEEAKRRMAGSAVLVLSGLVQWRKQRPAVAEGELARAVEMGPDNCEAASYLGAVRSELGTWLPAADAFARAEACREDEVVALRKTLDDLRAHTWAAPAIESQQKAIVDTEQQAAEMAFNRGAMLANAGDLAAARTHIERAGRHPALRVKAAERLERLRSRSP